MQTHTSCPRCGAALTGLAREAQAQMAALGVFLIGGALARWVVLPLWSAPLALKMGLTGVVLIGLMVAVSRWVRYRRCRECQGRDRSESPPR